MIRGASCPMARLMEDISARFNQRNWRVHKVHDVADSCGAGEGGSGIGGEGENDADISPAGPKDTAPTAAFLCECVFYNVRRGNERGKRDGRGEIRSRRNRRDIAGYGVRDADDIGNQHVYPGRPRARTEGGRDEMTIVRDSDAGRQIMRGDSAV